MFKGNAQQQIAVTNYTYCSPTNIVHVWYTIDGQARQDDFDGKDFLHYLKETIPVFKTFTFDLNAFFEEGNHPDSIRPYIAAFISSIMPTLTNVDAPTSPTKSELIEAMDEHALLDYSRAFTLLDMSVEEIAEYHLVCNRYRKITGEDIPTHHISTINQ